MRRLLPWCSLFACLLLHAAAIGQPAAVAPVPVLLTSVSTRVLDAVARTPVDSTSPINLQLRGMEVSGTGRLLGQLSVTPYPCTAFGVFAVTLQGKSESVNQSQRLLTRADSFNQSDVLIRQALYLTPQGLLLSEPMVHAPTTAQILAVQPHLPLMTLVRRTALFQEAANRLATEGAGIHLYNQFRQQSSTQWQQVNEPLQKYFLKPLYQAGVAPQHVHFATTEQALSLGVYHYTRATYVPPPPAQTADVQLTMHQELVNTLLQAQLAGRTIKDIELENSMTGVQDLFNTKLAPGAEQRPWSLTYARQEPVAVQFRNDQIDLVLRAAEITSGDETYPPMNIMTSWKAEGLSLIRGDIEVYPPGFIPGLSPPLPGRVQGLRTMLRRRFENILPKEVNLDISWQPPPLSGAEKTSAPAPIYLRAARLSARANWLLVEWQLPEEKR